jgi:hypothetical protein
MIESELEALVRRDGYAFARAAQVRERLKAGEADALSDWKTFADSWNALKPDEYMADGGRYRRRRHSVLSAAAGQAYARLEPRQPHFQTVEYNPLNGGVERWFEPIEMEVLTGPTMRAVVGFGLSLFGRLRPDAAWKIELHQFRIEAKAGAPGNPTPEGAHRDGVDCVLVLLVRRENVASGTTTVHDAAGKELGAFTLTDALDCAIVDDARVLHGVTPVTPVDPSKPAYRDVLVATFRKK